MYHAPFRSLSLISLHEKTTRGSWRQDHFNSAAAAVPAILVEEHPLDGSPLRERRKSKDESRTHEATRKDSH